MTPKSRRLTSKEVPDSIWRLAEKRTEHLIKKLFWWPMRDIITNAYVQGLRDAAQATNTEDKQ